MRHILKYFCLLIFLIFFLTQCKLEQKDDQGFLILKRDEKTSLFGYYNIKGEKILGDYFDAKTDTLKDYAIVANPNYTLINKKGEIVYEFFVFDNGPDPTVEGYYRIVEDGKIGYVDSLTSKIIVQPIYECACPFDNGIAKVSLHGKKGYEGEHYRWESNEWFYIDKKGNRID